MSENIGNITFRTGPQTVWFGMLNSRGESVNISLADARGFLRFRHPILWHRNKDLRQWFKNWEG